MQYQVSWSRHETGEVGIEANSASEAALKLKNADPPKGTLITGVTEMIGDEEGAYTQIDEWCESCGNPIFEGDAYASDGEVFLCHKCKGKE